tara:strand:+ start:80 stop:568 length:489 start_codon:yes stop_codon:yes gene_type:complete
MKKLLILGIFLAMPILSEPITVFGLNWGMEPMKTAIEKNEYSCSADAVSVAFRKVYGLPPLETPPQICKKGDKEIRLQPEESITFNCKVFNGCNSNLREISNNLSDYLGMQFRLDNKVSADLGFCARGSEGDLICVHEDRDWGTNTVVLYKSSYGTGGMTFD